MYHYDIGYYSFTDGTRSTVLVNATKFNRAKLVQMIQLMLPIAQERVKKAGRRVEDYGDLHDTLVALLCEKFSFQTLKTQASWYCPSDVGLLDELDKDSFEWTKEHEEVREALLRPAAPERR